MFRNCVAGVALSIVMMGGAAMAQSMSTETTTTRSTTSSIPPVTIAPAPGDVSESKTQTTVDSNGRETEKSEVYRSGDGRTEASSSTTIKEPDGTVRKQHQEEWQVMPQAQTTTTTRTTTTTDR